MHSYVKNVCTVCNAAFVASYVGRCPLDDGVLRRVIRHELIGGTIAQRFEIERPVYRYETGDEFIAMDRMRQTRVNIWLARHPRQSLSSSIRNPFVREVVDSGMHDNRVYVVFTHTKARPLRDLLRRASLAPDVAATVFRDVLSALRAAHHVGTHHLALRPDHIFVDEDGRAAICGFGDVASSGIMSVFHPGLHVQFAYSAPEQLLGAALPASDVYRFGVCLFEALVGTPLHQNIQVGVSRDAFTMPEHLSLQPFKPVLERALEEDAAQRATLVELAQLFPEASTLSSEPVATFDVEELSEDIPLFAPVLTALSPDAPPGQFEHPWSPGLVLDGVLVIEARLGTRDAYRVYQARRLHDDVEYLVYVPLDDLDDHQIVAMSGSFEVQFPDQEVVALMAATETGTPYLVAVRRQ